MGRKPRLEPSGRDWSQLNATIPEQLLLDFNSYCQETRSDERRDDILEEAIRWYLGRKRKGPKRAPAPPTSVAPHEDCDVVIERARQYAAKIFEVTSTVVRSRKRSA